MVLHDPGTCTPIPQPGQTITCTTEFTVTGGTGRFADARGAGRLIGTIVFPGLEVPVWPARWDWTGWISY